MKWIALIPMSIILAACGYNTETVEYKGTMTPVANTRVVYTQPVVAKRCCPSLIRSARCCPYYGTAVVTPRCCGYHHHYRHHRCCGAINTPIVYDTLSTNDTVVEYY